MILSKLRLPSQVESQAELSAKLGHRDQANRFRFDSDHAMKNRIALCKTRFAIRTGLCLVKFSVNVEHAWVNKQSSHLHDCPSVTDCLPRQRYYCAGLRFIQRLPIDKFDAEAGSNTRKENIRINNIVTLQIRLILFLLISFTFTAFQLIDKVQPNCNMMQ